MKSLRGKYFTPPLIESQRREIGTILGLQDAVSSFSGNVTSGLLPNLNNLPGLQLLQFELLPFPYCLPPSQWQNTLLQREMGNLAAAFQEFSYRCLEFELAILSIRRSERAAISVVLHSVRGEIIRVGTSDWLREVMGDFGPTEATVESVLASFGTSAVIFEWLLEEPPTPLSEHLQTLAHQLKTLPSKGVQRPTTLSANSFRPEAML